MALLLLVLPLLLAACGGDEATPTDEPPFTRATTTQAVSNQTANATGGAAANATATVPAGTPVPASTASVPPSPTPAGPIKADQQTLNLTLGDVATFDPALAADSVSIFTIRQLYSGLVSLDKDLNVVPDLATKMPLLTENNTLYTFTLHQGARFAGGREITADDFKYSFERATDPKLADPDTADSLPAATYMTDIVGVKDKLAGKASELSGVRVKDKYTLQIKLDAPKPQFLAKLSYVTFFVVNKDAVAKGFDQPDGSGPFKLSEYKRGQSLKLVRNEGYYFGAPRLTQVNFAIGDNAANSLSQYQQGKLDIIDVGASDAEQVLDRNNPLNKELVVKPELSVTYLGFNTHQKPFDDPKVRNAFSIVVDRARIASAMFQNKVQAAATLLPPGLPGYTGNPGPLTYDVSKARDLISQSSYRSPSNLPKITLYSTGDPLAGVLQDAFKKAFDIEVQVQDQEYRDFQSGLASKQQYQMFLYSWIADYPDPDNFLRTLLGAGSANNYTTYASGQFEDLLKQADQQTDLIKRLDLYGQAEQVALADAPLLPIYHRVDYTLAKPYVKGLEVTDMGVLSLKDVYILK